VAVKLGATPAGHRAFRAQPDHLGILILSIYYAPEITGNAPYVAGLAEHWAGRGHHVTVVTGDAHYPEWRRRARPAPDGENPTVRRYRHYVPRVHNAATRLRYEASWLLSASRALTSGSFDVAIGVSPTLSGAVLANLAGWRFRIPFGLIFQDLIGQAAAQSGYPGSRSVAKQVQAVEGTVARRANQIAIVAENFRDYLEASGVAPDRIVRVRNWSHQIEADESREDTRKRLGWPAGAFVCLHAGNMGQKQGLDNLIEGAKRLRSENVLLVLAGDGNDRERLIALVRDEALENVSFIHSSQSPEQFASMLSAADVLVLNQRPSVSDMALPSKLAAYFASGRPVIAAVAGSSSAGRELASAGAGILVSPGDPVGLAAAVHALMAGPDDRERLGANGRAYAARYLARDQALADYDGFLDSLAPTPRPAGAAEATK
jgi:glycosyltransferase involved in cell wall biosynthesis